MKDATSDIRASISASHLINELEYAVLARAQGLPGSAEKLPEAKQALRAALSASPTSGEPTEQQALDEMSRYLPVLARLQDMPDVWEICTAGLGIATINGYATALGRARSLIAGDQAGDGVKTDGGKSNG